MVADSCVPARSFNARVWVFLSRIFQSASLSNIAGGAFGLRKGILSARYSFRKNGDNKKSRITRHHNGTKFGRRFARSALAKRDPRRKLHFWIKDITVVQLFTRRKARFVAYRTVRCSFSLCTSSLYKNTRNIFVIGEKGNYVSNMQNYSYAKNFT